MTLFIITEWVYQGQVIHLLYSPCPVGTKTNQIRIYIMQVLNWSKGDWNYVKKQGQLWTVQKKKKRILVPISKDFYFHYYWQLCYYAPKVPLTKSLYEESKKNSSCPDKHTDWENEVTEQVKATVQVKLQFQGLIYYPNIILSFRPDGKILRDSFLSESFSSLCLPKLLTFSFS